MGPVLEGIDEFYVKIPTGLEFYGYRWEVAGATCNTSLLLFRMSSVPSVRLSCSFFHVQSLTISLLIRRQITMVFACQQDSFLRKFKTKVVSCKAGKLAGKDAYELILEDTVLFPEGGGQVG